MNFYQFISSWTYFFVIPILAIAAPTNESNFQVVDGARPRVIPNGAYLEGSANFIRRDGTRGQQPDFYVNYDAPAFAKLRQFARQIGRSSMSTWEKVEALVLHLKQNVLPRKEDTEYLAFLRSYTSRNADVPLSDYLDGGAGVCRENALFMHMMLHEAGIDSGYVYATVEVVAAGRGGDHAFNVIRDPDGSGQLIIVDSHNPLYHRTPFSADNRITGRAHVMSVNQHPRVWIPINSASVRAGEGGAFFSAAPPRPPVDLAIDIDETIGYLIRPGPDGDPLVNSAHPGTVVHIDYPQPHGSNYRIYEGVQDALQRWLEMQRAGRVRLSFFSGGEAVRNRALLAAIQLPNGSTALDLVGDRVFSRENMTPRSSQSIEARLRRLFGQPTRIRHRLGKDLTLVSGQASDLDNTILVDDICRFAIQLGHTLCLGENLRTSRVPTALEIERESTKWRWIVAVIEEAISLHEREGITFKQAVARITRNGAVTPFSAGQEATVARGGQLLDGIGLHITAGYRQILGLRVHAACFQSSLGSVLRAAIVTP